MGNPTHLVTGYLQALGQRDFAAARTLLSEDFAFEGPFDTFNDPDSYLGACDMNGRGSCCLACNRSGRKSVLEGIVRTGFLKNVPTRGNKSIAG